MKNPNPRLKLGFSSTFKNCELFFTDILSRRYDVIRDDVAPDYLIFGDSNFGNDHLKYDHKNVSKIFFTGENVRPNYFTYNHAITFDFENSPKHYRLPLYALEMWAIVKDNKFTEDYYYLRGLHKTIDWEKAWILKSGRYDMTYVQSNSNAEPRKSYVDSYSKLFNVGCGGPHMNNIGHVIPRDRLLKFDFLRKYKMNIAFENSFHPDSGYVTEKLLDAFYSCTLPIYLGPLKVFRDFNTKSFLRQLPGPVKYEEIKHYLTSKILWCEMMSQPRFNYDIPNEYCQLDNFLDWFGENVYHG